MYFPTLVAGLFLGLAAAQSTESASTTVSAPTTTGTAPSTTGTTLPDLVSQLPGCAVSCFQTVATQVGCTGATDFSCLCTGSQAPELITKVTTCIGIGTSCDLAKTGLIATGICALLDDNPSQADLASASAVVSSELVTATRSAGASRPTEAVMGAMGVAAAFAVFAM